jgi:signal peptide peptidase SppA
MTTRRNARPNVRAIVDGMHLQAAMIAPHYAGLAGALQELADADFGLEEAAWESRKNDLCAAYGFGQANSDKPFAFANGVAIIPVHGVLVNRFSYSWGYATGYNFLRAQRAAAEADDDVKLIVYDCNSYGGMVAGCFETADAIFESRSVKPSLAVVDASAYSACYAIASAASKLVVVPSAGVGSIGVVAMHMNMGPMLKEWGIEITFIHAGKHKVDGNPYEALPDDVKKNIQSSIDKSYATFANNVARNRSISADAVKATEAQTYDADDALALGLIDAVQTPAQAVAAYLDELSGSKDQQEFTMTTQTTQPGAESKDKPDTAAIQAAARTAERERMAGITNCEEAKGKSKLANHLALNTDMSVDDAKQVLAAAAPEVAPAAESKGDAGKKADAGGNSPFADAMARSGNPDVGAGDAGADGDNGKDKGGSLASRILAAQQAATGRDLSKD